MSSGSYDLSTTPAAAPPPGQEVNFVNPDSQKDVMIGVSSTMIVLTLIFVAMRMYSSFVVTKKPGIEDWTCITAVILSFAYIGVILSLAYYARHMWDVPLSWFTDNYWQVRFAGNTLQALAYFVSRLPILFLYLRLFGTRMWFRVACYAAIGFAFCIYITSIPLLSYFCTPNPPGGSWNDLELFARCKKLLPWAMIQGSCDIALNVYILLLPMTVIARLHMSTPKKLGIFSIFLTGLLGVVCSALGLYYRYLLSFTADVNWNEGNFITMSVVEINVAIICGCMPACASFYKNVLGGSAFFSSLRSVFTGGRTSGKGSSKGSSQGYSSQNAGGFGSVPVTHDSKSMPSNYIQLSDPRAGEWGDAGYYSGSATALTTDQQVYQQHQVQQQQQQQQHYQQQYQQQYQQNGVVYQQPAGTYQPNGTFTEIV